MKISMKQHSGKGRAYVFEIGYLPLVAAILASVATIGLGTGCSNGDPASVDVADPIDACTLLTRSDAETVLETALQEPGKNQYGRDDAWISNCQYVSMPDEAPIRQAGLLLGPHHVSEGASRAYDDYESSLRSELGSSFEMEFIDGLGEKAGWFDDGSGGQLTIFQGSYRLIVSSSKTDSNTSLNNQKLLAEKALESLSHLRKD